MKKSILIISMCFFVLFFGINSKTVFSQSIIDTIAIQDFEVSPQSPVWSYSGTPTFLNGYTIANASPSNSPIGINGSRAWETHAVSSGSILEFNNTTIPAIYDTIWIGFRLAAMSLSSTSGGPDNLDYVEVSYSLDNGLTYINRLTIKGATTNNSTWAYSATGLAEVFYQPSSTTVFQPTTSGLQTTMGYSTCGISFPGTISQLKLKIKVRSSSSSDTWCVDNVVLTGKKTCSNTTSTISETACNSLTSQSGNQIWTTSGTYTDTIPNASGCDSIIILNLTIDTTTFATISPTSCFTYTSPSGNYIWGTTGTYMDTIPNVAGCDSIITIILTIDTVNTLITQTGIDLTANAIGASYQWLDCNNLYSMISGAINQSFIPTANGSYAVEITENTCVDTSICFTINNVGINDSEFNLSLNAYPNPISGKINVDLGKTYNNVNIVVRNVLGQIVFTQTYKTTNLVKFEINESPGVYFIEIRTEEGKSKVIEVLKE